MYLKSHTAASLTNPSNQRRWCAEAGGYRDNGCTGVEVLYMMDSLSHTMIDTCVFVRHITGSCGRVAERYLFSIHQADVVLHLSRIVPKSRFIGSQTDTGSQSSYITVAVRQSQAASPDTLL